jgi:molecular chaperone Hsp33
MTSDTLIKKWDEQVLPFQLDASNIRGRIARLDTLLDDVLSQHNYPPQVSALVAEAVMLTALIGQTVKLRWKLSLQIRGDGPIRIIATDYYGPGKNGEPAKIRAYASYDKKRLAESNKIGFENIGKGMFAVLMDQGEHMKPYQGITPLSQGSLSRCAETYFAQSEQLPTRFEVVVGESSLPGEAKSWRAGGVMVQHLPKASHLMAKDLPSSTDGLLTAGDLLSGDESAEDWNRVNILLNTVEEIELIGPNISSPELLNRLFHEETPRLFDPQTVRFGCSCGEEKVRNTMSIYSQKDISHMIDENGMVTADCQFCGSHYELDPKSLGFEGGKN